jgi:hypothetical protein
VKLSYKRILPWLVAAFFFAAFCVSYVRNHQIVAKLEQATYPLYHRHADVRQFFIRAALDGVPSPIVVIGDSITEGAPLPATACGHPVINAGIGGASTSDFRQLAPVLFDGTPGPHLIVVALGANDVGSGSLTRDFSALLSQLSGLAPRIIAVSNTADEGVLAQQRAATAAMHVPFYEIKVTGLMADHIHYTHEGYAEWVPVIFRAVSSACLQGRSAAEPARF